MNWNDIRILYLRELRSALRERGIVVNSILIPILMYPLLIWLMYTGITFVSGQADDLKSRIMVTGLPETHRALMADLTTDRNIEIVELADPLPAIQEDRLDVLVEFTQPESSSGLPGNFHARLTFDESRDQSSQARARVAGRIGEYRQQYLGQQASEMGLSRERFQGFWITAENTSSGRQMGQFILGLLLPMMLVIMLAIGGFYPAVDSTAGERENSTWETVMTLATSRTNVLLAKYLYVATMSLMAGVMNLAAMTFSMRTVLAPLGGNALGDLSFQIPLQSIPVLLLGAALLALFVSAGMMVLASFARTFKEGQSMASPFYIALMVPVMFLQAPGLEFTTQMAFVPVVNVTMMFREAIMGIYQWQLIGITLVVELVCIAAALRLALAIVRHEDYMLGTYSGTFGQFVKDRLLRRT